MSPVGVGACCPDDCHPFLPPLHEQTIPPWRGAVNSAPPWLWAGLRGLLNWWVWSLAASPWAFGMLAFGRLRRDTSCSVSRVTILWWSCCEKTCGQWVAMCAQKPARKGSVGHPPQLRPWGSRWTAWPSPPHIPEPRSCAQDKISVLSL